MAGVGVGGPGRHFLEVAFMALSTPLSVETVQPGPPMAPYLPKEDVKWPPALQPPVGLGPPAPAPNLLVPPHGDPAGFGHLLPGVLPNLEPGPLDASLPPAEQLLPDLLISPHMLPCKEPGCAGWVGWVGAVLKVEVELARKVEDDGKENKACMPVPQGWGKRK